MDKTCLITYAVILVSGCAVYWWLSKAVIWAIGG